MAPTATQVIDSEILPHVEESDWEGPQPGEERYSPNQMIAAYQAGLVKGVDNASKLIQDQFQRNLETSGIATKKLLDKMATLKLRALAARLRVESWDYFEILISLPEADWLSEAAMEMLDYSATVEEAADSEFFHLVLHFCGVGEVFNQSLVEADGYVWTYKPLAEAE
jgi:hypothetical protein